MAASLPPGDTIMSPPHDRAPDRFPPVTIFVHERERRSKCSVEPLRSDPRFLFHDFPDRTGWHPPEGAVRLGVDGPEYSLADAQRPLVVLDATWRLAEVMERGLPAMPARRLAGWNTAYPRVSKLFDDPLGGLATVEAIAAAFLIIGRPLGTLLGRYHWRREFLELNAERLGATPVPDL
jgi:pre-rRNA-processing protein TSR3